MTYLLLFVLGAMEGLIGCFQFPHTIGSVPAAALGFSALILVTCLLGGAGMGSPIGALAPAVGWLVTALILTLPTAAGSVVVTNTTEGKWYLYGGAVCAGAGVAICFGRARRPRGPRPGRLSRLPGHLLDPVQGPVQVAFADRERRSEPDRGPVGVLGQHAARGEALACFPAAE